MRWLPLILAAACVPAAPPAFDPPEPPPKRSPAEILEERRTGACSGPIDEPQPAVLIEPPVLAEGFVGAVRVEGNARVADEAIRGTIATSPGAAVDPKQIAADVAALWNTGDFSDVSVDTLGEQADLSVVFTVRERPLVGEVFGDAKLALEIYDRHKLDIFTRELRDRLVAEGFPRASVVVRRRRPEPGVVDLCVVVDRGK